MSNETTPPPVPVGEGFLRKFLSKFSVSRDKGLREDLENVIETHQAQNPQDGLGPGNHVDDAEPDQVFRPAGR